MKKKYRKETSKKKMDDITLKLAVLNAICNYESNLPPENFISFVEDVFRWVKGENNAKEVAKRELYWKESTNTGTSDT